MADISDLRIDHSAQRAARNPWRAAFFALFALVLAVAAVVGFAWAMRIANAPDSQEPLTVLTYTSPPTDASQSPPATFTAAGYVEVVPPGALVVTSLVPGVVRDLAVREGQRIRQGDRIATLDTSAFQWELVQAESEIAVLRARLARLEAGFLPEEIEQSRSRVVAAESALQYAVDHLERQTHLAESGATSRRALLEAEREVMQASAALTEAQADLRIKQLGARPEDIAIARAELARAEADRDHIQWKVEQCVVRAPIDGIVFQQFAQPGQWIAPDDSNSAGAIVSVFTPGPGALQAWVDVNQRDIGRVHIGQRVTLVADSDPGIAIVGEVAEFMPRASIERNTIRVKVSIEGDHEHLRPDMSLRITFHEHKPGQSARSPAGEPSAAPGP